MQTQYYEILEPSAHETTRDGLVFWSGTAEDVPEWGGDLRQKVEEMAAGGWSPGPVGGGELEVVGGEGNTLIKLPK